MKQGSTTVPLHLLERSPEAGHLLARLHDSHRLYGLAENSDVSARGELAGIMADLLEIKLSNSEKALLTDLLTSLIRQAGNDLKKAVAERLSVMEDVPLPLIAHLANEEIFVADSILRRSRVLDEMDLLYIIKSQGEGHWRSIAMRPDLSHNLIDVLAETKDMGTAVNLTENKNIGLTDKAVTIFCKMAKESDALAKPLLMRDELPNDLAMTLYRFVGHELQGYIKEKFGDVKKDVFGEAVESVIRELSMVGKEIYDPTPIMIKTAENMHVKGFLKTEAMIENLRRGQVANFVALFSVYCAIPPKTVLEMLEQRTAQGLAIACKAKGIYKPEFVNIFLLTSRVRGGNIVAQSELQRALSYYDRVSEDMAKRILDRNRH